MSVYISSRIWATPFPNATRKLVALSLADQATDEGFCWPSVRSICERCGIGDSMVREHITGLCEAGFLEKKERTAETGRQTSNLFRILVEHLPPLPAYRYPPTGLPAPPPSGTPAPPPTGVPAPLKRNKETPLEKHQEGGLFDSAVEEQRKSATSTTMIEIWNKSVPSLSKLTRMSGERLKLAMARWKDLGNSAPEWQRFCDKVEASDFLKGKNDRNWTATFDWCMIPANFDKVREDRYANKPKTDEDNQPSTAKRFW